MDAPAAPSDLAGLPELPDFDLPDLLPPLTSGPEPAAPDAPAAGDRPAAWEGLELPQDYDLVTTSHRESSQLETAEDFTAPGFTRHPSEPTARPGLEQSLPGLEDSADMAFQAPHGPSGTSTPPGRPTAYPSLPDAAGGQLAGLTDLDGPDSFAGTETPARPGAARREMEALDTAENYSLGEAGDGRLDRLTDALEGLVRQMQAPQTRPALPPAGPTSIGPSSFDTPGF